jgi:hypothetical protein
VPALDLLPRRAEIKVDTSMCSSSIFLLIIMYEKASSKGRIILAIRNLVRKLVQLDVHHSVSFVPFFFSTMAFERTKRLHSNKKIKHGDWN